MRRWLLLESTTLSLAKYFSLFSPPWFLSSGYLLRVRCDYPFPLFHILESPLLISGIHREMTFASNL
jgi:hypothetical protein